MTTSRGNLPLNVATLSWHDGVKTVLDSSEKRIEGLSRQFDATAKRLERRTHVQLGQFKRQFASGQTWLRERIEWLRALESKAETAFETSRIMMHFAQKDAKEMFTTYKNRYAKARAKIECLRDKDRNNEHADSHKQLRKSKKDDAIGIPLADQRS